MCSRKSICRLQVCTCICVYVSHQCLSLTRTREYQEKVQAMSVELEQVRSRLQVTERQASEPPPLLLKLQEEMAEMKVRQ